MSREKVREIYPIKYEKMPIFCGACGFIGHTHQECGTGEHEEENLKWGDFLKAVWDTWNGRGFGGGRGGARSGRGSGDSRGVRGRTPGRRREGGIDGRGFPLAWRYNALAYFDGIAHVGGKGTNPISPGVSKDLQIKDGELQDTGTSPIKNNLMDVDKPANSTDSCAKRRLDVTLVDNTNVHRKQDEDMLANEVAAGLVNPEDTRDNVSSESDNNKRPNKDGVVSPSLGSAGSHGSLSGANEDIRLELSGFG
jgi:hypothetical protein